MTEERVHMLIQTSPRSVSQVLVSDPRDGYSLSPPLFKHLMAPYTKLGRTYYECDEPIRLSTVLAVTDDQVSSWRRPMLKFCRVMLPPELWRWQDCVHFAERAGLQRPTVAVGSAPGRFRYSWGCPDLFVELEQGQPLVQTVSSGLRAYLVQRAEAVL